MKDSSYKLTHADGSTDEISNEELAILEENVEYVSFKKTLSKNYNTVSCEISSSVSNLGLKKTITFCRQKAEFETQRALDKI